MEPTNAELILYISWCIIGVLFIILGPRIYDWWEWRQIEKANKQPEFEEIELD